MDRPVITLVAIKVIVIRRSPEARAITKTRNDFRRRWRPLTRVRHVFGNMTAYASVHPVNQTSSSRRADYPVVNVALDQGLSTKLFPLRKVDGVVVCFAQGGGVVEIGTSTGGSTGQFGLGVIAFD